MLPPSDRNDDEVLDLDTVMSPDAGDSLAQLGIESPPLQAMIVVGQKVRVVQLPRQGSLKIGRHAGAEISIEERTLSRFHAILHLGPPLTLEDLNSANGSFVRDRRVRPGTTQEVTLGDVIRLGEVTIILKRPPRR